MLRGADALAQAVSQQPVAAEHDAEETDALCVAAPRHRIDFRKGPNGRSSPSCGTS